MDKKEAYRGFIENLSFNKDELPFANSGNDKKSLVLSNILKTSNDVVIMYYDNFNSDVTNDDEFYDRIKDYILLRDSEIYVMLKNEPDPKSDSFMMLNRISKHNTKVKIRTNVGNIFNTDTEFFFTVGDKRSYYIETEDGSCSGCFNDKEISERLFESYMKVF